MMNDKISKSETREYRPTLSHLATVELRRSQPLQFDSLGYVHLHIYTHTYIHAHNQDRSHNPTHLHVRVIIILVKCLQIIFFFSKGVTAI